MSTLKALALDQQVGRGSPIRLGFAERPTSVATDSDDREADQFDRLVFTCVPVGLPMRLIERTSHLADDPVPTARAEIDG